MFATRAKPARRENRGIRSGSRGPLAGGRFLRNLFAAKSLLRFARWVKVHWRPPDGSKECGTNELRLDKAHGTRRFQLPTWRGPQPRTQPGGQKRKCEIAFAHAMELTLLRSAKKRKPEYHAQILLANRRIAASHTGLLPAFAQFRRSLPGTVRYLTSGKSLVNMHKQPVRYVSVTT